MNGARLPAVAALCAALSGGCGPARLGPPPSPAAHVVEPAHLVPGDLDVVVRIDMARFTRDLGPLAVAAVDRSIGPASSDPPGEGLLRAVLSHADTLWLGLRPSNAVARVDWTLVARGRFAALRPREFGGAPPWGAETDLGADWHRQERGVTPRSAPSALWRHGDTLVVVTSIAELDAVERTIEARIPGEGPRAPERGVVAIAARGGALVEALRGGSPMLSRALLPARTLTATLDLLDDAVEVNVELTCDDEAAAGSVAEALTGPLAHVVRSSDPRIRLTGPTPVASRVAISVTAPLALLGALVDS